MTLTLREKMAACAGEIFKFNAGKKDDAKTETNFEISFFVVLNIFF